MEGSRGSWPWVRSLDRPAACALALIPGLVPHCAQGLDLTPFWGQEDQAKDADTGVESGRSCSSLPPGPPALGTVAVGQEDSRVLSPVLSPAS